MVSGWKRAFCTSIPKHREPKVLTEKQQHCNCDNSPNTNQSPKISSKFTFFTNPSTPQPQFQLVSRPSLRCQTTGTPTSSVPNSPKLQCSNAKTPKKHNIPSLFHLSNPLSPKSPSTFSLLKASLRLSKRRCGICTQSTRTGEGTAIFTAECTHVFHFPCIAAHVQKHQTHTCPVCSTNWKELSPVHILKTAEENRAQNLKTKSSKLYNDDEPLASPASVARFNPIPESDENENGEEQTEFQGFNVNAESPKISSVSFEMRFLPEAAIVASNRNHVKFVAVLKVTAPQSNAVARRPPVDLVTVLDASSPKLQTLKRSMRLVISSLGSADRLSVVAFSAGGSKRLFPLRRMTAGGQRAARQAVDAVGVTGDGAPAKNDALWKAAKVIEDRRHKNAVAGIVLLSDRHDERVASNFVSSTRYSHREIPFRCLRLHHAPPEDAVAKCLGSLLCVVAHDFRLHLEVVSRKVPAEIAAVYSLSGRPASLGPGSAALGDLYAAEERELLVELKVPAVAVSCGSHHVLSVRSSYRDPFTREFVYSVEKAIIVPRPQAVRSMDPKIERLRSLHASARAVAKSSRLVVEQKNVCGAREAEKAELRSQKRRSNSCLEQEKVEPLTPMSAWRAAERLAKVAIMRKSMNKVSDLHGFENARF